MDFIGHDTYTLLKFVEGKDEPELYLNTYPHHLYPLSIGFSEYIELTIAFRGLHLWQSYFIKPEAGPLHPPVPDRFFRNVKLLFPDVDLSRFPEVKQEEPDYSFAILAAQKNYAGRLNHMVDELQTRLEGVGKVTFESNPGVSLMGIRKAMAVIGQDLPDSFLAFYRSMNGFELEWKLDGDEYTYARFQMPPLQDVFGGLRGEYNRDWNSRFLEGIIDFDILSEKEVEFCKRLRLIYSAEYNDTFIHLDRLDGKSSEPQLYVSDEGFFIPLTINFEEFLELLMETRGLEYWQRFLTKEENYSDREFATIPPLHSRMEKIFPKANLSRFRQPSGKI